MEEGNPDTEYSADIVFSESELLTQYSDDFAEKVRKLNDENSIVAAFQSLQKTVGEICMRQKSMMTTLNLLKLEMNSARLQQQKVLEILTRVFEDGPHGESQSLLHGIVLPNPANSENSKEVEYVTAKIGDSSKPLMLSPGVHSKIMSTDIMRSVVREILTSLHTTEFLVNCTLTGERKGPKTAKSPRLSIEDINSQRDIEHEDSSSEGGLRSNQVHALPFESYQLILAGVNKKFPLRPTDDFKMRTKLVREHITHTLQYIKKNYKELKKNQSQTQSSQI